MGYHGETLDVGKTLEALQIAAAQREFKCGQTKYQGKYPQLVFERKAAEGSKLVLISSGIHGDEPAGPLAILKLLKGDLLSRDLSWIVFPVLCPENLASNRRECSDGTDPNRDYRNPQTPEIRSQVEWLAKRAPKIDTALLLHEDWESKGYYLYEQVDYEARSFAREMLEATSPICGVNQSPEIEDMPADKGLISLRGATPLIQEWPESIYLINLGARRSYTLEAPSEQPMIRRVDAHIAAAKVLNDALKHLRPKA